ncbi:hypothetical protein [Endozoicomonas montiporae]|uniref:hypothetical protein n=1 Tax=Endozoicomonas montiporae TaxID=1027273 RepID=UPI000A8FD721|nr:hypothetical protein [Endozoicomonas montiporae]
MVRFSARKNHKAINNALPPTTLAQPVASLHKNTNNRATGTGLKHSALFYLQLHKDLQ